MDIKLDVPLPDGFNEKSFIVTTPRAAAFLATEGGTWANSLEEAKAKVAELANEGIVWIVQPVQVASAEVLPARTKLRFTATRTRAKRVPKARAKRKLRKAEPIAMPGN